MNELSPASFTRLQFRWSASYRALLKPPLTSTAPQSRIETVAERMFEQSRSLAGRIKGLRMRYASMTSNLRTVSGWFFAFVLALVVPGALMVLFPALLWIRRI